MCQGLTFVKKSGGKYSYLTCSDDGRAKIIGHGPDGGVWN